jgi:putative membrane protein
MVKLDIRSANQIWECEVLENKRSLTLHYLLRAAILTGFAMYILFLVKTGNIVYYIAPRMVVYVKLAAIGFYIIAVYQAYIAIGSFWKSSKPSCDCEHPPSSSIFRNMIVYSMFIIPLVLGFMLPDTAMGSDLAAKRGVNLNSSRALINSNSIKTASTPITSLAPTTAPLNREQPNVIETPAPTALNKLATSGAVTTDEQLKEMFKADAYAEQFAQIGMKLYKQDLIQVKVEGFMEILSSIDLFQENFIGKKLEISGFVYHEDDMLPNQFVVARFSVSCCSADASPFGVMIESSNANKFAKDTWVKVTGVIGKTKYADNEIMKLDASKIEKIPAAKDPYVYPNYDYLAQ